MRSVSHNGATIAVEWLQSGGRAAAGLPRRCRRAGPGSYPSAERQHKRAGTQRPRPALTRRGSASWRSLAFASPPDACEVCVRHGGRRRPEHDLPGIRLKERVGTARLWSGYDCSIQEWRPLPSVQNSFLSRHIIARFPCFLETGRSRVLLLDSRPKKCKKCLKIAVPFGCDNGASSAAAALPRRPRTLCAVWITSSRSCKTPSGSLRPTTGRAALVASGELTPLLAPRSGSSANGIRHGVLLLQSDTLPASGKDAQIGGRPRAPELLAHASRIP